MVAHRLRDTNNLVYLILWIIGAGVLFPWNAFISAPDYFTKFHEFVAPDTKLTSQQETMWNNILTYFTVGYAIFDLLGQAMVVYLGERLRISDKVLYSISLMFLVMLIVPIVSYVKMDVDLAFWLLVSSAAICGLLTAFLQATSFGLGALFPPRFTQAVMIGNGSSGLAVSLLRVVTKAAGGGVKLSGAIYFYLATAWLLVSLGSFIIMRKLRFAQKHVMEFVTFERVVLDNESVTTAETHQTEETHIQSPALVPAEPDSELTRLTPARKSTYAIFKIVFPMGCAVFLTLFVSLTVFPGVTARVPSPLSDGWFTVWLIVLYNAADNLGRVSPRFYIPSRRPFLASSVLRLAFIPLILFCVKPDYFTSSAWPVVFVGLMAYTNGYCASLAMMFGPDTPSIQPEDRETAGNIMSFMLLAGMTTGSAAGMVICQFLPNDGSDSSG